MDLDLIKGMFETAPDTFGVLKKQPSINTAGRIYGYLHPYSAKKPSRPRYIALRPDDYIVSTHRGHGHAIAKGHDIKLMLAELMGKESGYCHGRGGSMHVANLAQIPGSKRHCGRRHPPGYGAGLAVKYKGGDQVVVSFSAWRHQSGRLPRIHQPGRDLQTPCYFCG